MAALVWLALQASAVTYWLWRGTIFRPLRVAVRWRFWRSLWACPLCLGTWVGAAWYELAPMAPTLERFVGVAAMTGCLAMLWVRLCGPRRGD